MVMATCAIPLAEARYDVVDLKLCLGTTPFSDTFATIKVESIMSSHAPVMVVAIHITAFITTPTPSPLG